MKQCKETSPNLQHKSPLMIKTKSTSKLPVLQIRDQVSFLLISWHIPTLCRIPVCERVRSWSSE